MTATNLGAMKWAVSSNNKFSESRAPRPFDGDSRSPRGARFTLPYGPFTPKQPSNEQLRCLYEEEHKAMPFQMRVCVWFRLPFTFVDPIHLGLSWVRKLMAPLGAVRYVRRIDIVGLTEY